jgi:hypothetical protein
MTVRSGKQLQFSNFRHGEIKTFRICAMSMRCSYCDMDYYFEFFQCRIFTFPSRKVSGVSPWLASVDC